MAEYEFTGAKWGTRTLGTSGGQVSWSFASLPGSFYAFDAKISQVTYQNLVRSAFQAWEAVANIDFIEVADSAATKIRLGWDAIDGAYDTIGEASYSYTQGVIDQLTKAEIRFDTAENWTTTKYHVAGSVNFYAVALHEIGHALGLAHTDEADTIMFPTLGTQVALSDGDIAGARALYGTSSAAPAAPNVSFTGTSAADVYVGTSASEVILGKAGNDRLTGAGGNDRIEGGAGIDFATFSGSRNDFRLSPETDGDITVVDLRAGAPNGTDNLISVERLGFSDGNLAFDLDGNAGEAYRLYQAAFDRNPDVVGLGYWIDELDAGKGDLAWVANNFIISEEFKSTYGTPASVSDEAFLRLLYSNVLDRAPDAAGFDYWTNELDRGFGRERVLASFSESVENQGNVAAEIHDGIWYV